MSPIAAARARAAKDGWRHGDQRHTLICHRIDQHHLICSFPVGALAASCASLLSANIRAAGRTTVSVAAITATPETKTLCKPDCCIASDGALGQRRKERSSPLKNYASSVAIIQDVRTDDWRLRRR
jgi:hypothetical protein